MNQNETYETLIEWRKLTDEIISNTKKEKYSNSNLVYMKNNFVYI